MSQGQRVGLYARVSTSGQTPENQLIALRQFVAARGWKVVGEYVDRGVSGARDRRPALDMLMGAARKRKLDIVVCWRFDRFSRSLRALIAALEEFRALGIQFVSQQDAMDTTTPAGQLLFSMVGAFAQFERELLKERIHAGLSRARLAGTRLGRPKGPAVNLDAVRALVAGGKSQREACRALGIPRNSFWRAQRARLHNGGRAAGSRPVEGRG